MARRLSILVVLAGAVATAAVAVASNSVSATPNAPGSETRAGVRALGVTPEPSGTPAARRIMIGFYDDPSFRWSAQTNANLAAAASAHASIVHALVDWAAVAPTKPANPLNGNDPAYHLSDIDALVRNAEQDDLQVLLTITGTPAWANGGQTPNHPPTNLNDLTQFAQMLATRYNGSHAGFGVVTRFSVWNEPNLGLFLTPQYQGTTDREPDDLREALHGGLQRDQGRRSRTRSWPPGETSNRGRSTPTGEPGEDSVAPGTFAELLSLGGAQPALRGPGPLIPIPSDFTFGPSQKVAYPNVGFSTMTVRPDLRSGSSARCRSGSRVRRADHPSTAWASAIPFRRPTPEGPRAAPRPTPTCRCSSGSSSRQHLPDLVQRAQEGERAKKPSYAVFTSAATGMVGQSQVDRGRACPFAVTLGAPFMAWHDPAGYDGRRQLRDDAGAARRRSRAASGRRHARARPRRSASRSASSPRRRRATR